MKPFLRAPLCFSKSVIFIFAALFFLCGISFSQTVRYVSPTGLNTNPGTFASPFLTIAQGIAASANGDTIKVAAGTYTGLVTVNKQVAIVGSGATSSDVILNGTGYTAAAANGFAVTANNVSIKNIKVTNFNVAVTATVAVNISH